MKPQSKREPNQPLIDEAAFQQLLSAAYVMQEHNSRLKKSPKSVAPSTMPVQTPVESASTSDHTSSPSTLIPFPAATNTKPASHGCACEECGSELALNEYFCENCGAPTERSGNTTQKNWASLWDLHKASSPGIKAVAEESDIPFTNLEITPQNEAGDIVDLFPAELEEIVGNFAGKESGKKSAAEPPEDDFDPQPQHEDDLALTTVDPIDAMETADLSPTSTWTSAAKARAWLDSLKSPQSGKDWFRAEWRLHRGTISIALSSAVLLAVIFQWATQPAPVPGQPRQLSGFEQMLVSLGLAEAPPTPVNTPAPGNPDTKVWVDVHTALYYCPGAELYGKTPDGKYSTQLDAQRNNFQPSTLKACD